MRDKPFALLRNGANLLIMPTKYLEEFRNLSAKKVGARKAMINVSN